METKVIDELEEENIVGTFSIVLDCCLIFRGDLKVSLFC